jgi:hypothetical protein
MNQNYCIQSVIAVFITTTVFDCLDNLRSHVQNRRNLNVAHGAAIGWR